MDLSEIFRALSDPARLKIISMLAERGEQCVCEIVDELDMGQPAVSHHLTKLKYANLIKPQRKGQWIYYSLNYEILEEGVLVFLQQVVENAKEPKKERKSCCDSDSIDQCKEI